MEIGDNIKKIRKEKKLTQQELAKKIGISRSYLSDVENNRYNPSSKTIESFAEKLGVTMLYLTTGIKALGDLTDNEADDFARDIQKYLIQGNKDAQNSLKKNLEELLDTELNFVEVTYLTNVVTLLKLADKEDLSIILSLIVTFIEYAALKQTDNVDKEELSAMINNELDEAKDLFRIHLMKDD